MTPWQREQARIAIERLSLSLRIASRPVQAKTYRLKSKFTVEVLDDLKAYHDIDVDREAYKNLADNIAKSVDKKILESLKNADDWESY
jgi:hypothetical protein